MIDRELSAAVGGIGQYNIHDYRVHKVADALLFGAMGRQYLESYDRRAPRREMALLAFGYGWVYYRWLDWSAQYVQPL